MRFTREILQGMSETMIHPQFCRALKEMTFNRGTLKAGRIEGNTANIQPKFPFLHLHSIGLKN